MNRGATILVSGMIAGDPHQGGATWAILQYVLGLRELGHNVYLVEPVQSRERRPETSEFLASESANYFREVVRAFDLTDRAALLLAGTDQTVGVPYTELRRVAKEANVLINVSGMLTDEVLLSTIPFRVYLDLDPAFIQLWSAVEGIDMRFAAHTHFATIGLALGEESCAVPTCGVSWIKTLQPIVLKHWPLAEQLPGEALTTVGNWRGYGSVNYQGKFLGQKAHSFRPLFKLPKLTREKFRLALAIHPDETRDLEALRENHWQLVDPKQVAGNPDAYQQFIQGSLAEFGIAKSGYVVSQCGWFSDRSVCYLASGRPVLAQDTGFSRYLPTGAGLFTFAKQEDIFQALEELRSDYDKQRRRAREIAEGYFDSNRVLKRLLNEIGV